MDVPHMDQRELDVLVANGQVALAKFLRIDLAVAFTFLEIARLERDIDPSHAQALIAKVRTALGTIRALNSRVRDVDVWEEVRGGANALEAALGDISNFPDYQLFPAVVIPRA